MRYRIRTVATNKRGQCLIALTAAVAFALQGLLSAGIPAAVAADSGAIQFVTICTSNGYRQIVLDSQNKPVAPRDRKGCLDCCLMCCSLASLTVESCPTIEPLQQEVAITFANSLPSDRKAIRAWHSRAPPSDSRQTVT